MTTQPPPEAQKEGSVSEWQKKVDAQARIIAGYKIGSGMNQAGGTWDQDSRYISFKAGVAFVLGELGPVAELIEGASMLVDDDYVTTETADGEVETWVNHAALVRICDEALAQLRAMGVGEGK